MNWVPRMLSITFGHKTGEKDNVICKFRVLICLIYSMCCVSVGGCALE